MGNRIAGMATVLAQPIVEPNVAGEDVTSKMKMPPCRACTDFKSWAKYKFMEKRKQESTQDPKSEAESGQSEDASLEDEYALLEKRREHLQCPLDKDELGRETWGFLHTMAAYFPDNPSKTQQKEMSAFMKIFAKYYPCEHCAQDFQLSLKESPPETCSQSDLSRWLCKMHNEVNRKLGKPEFDCDRVNERWRDGWKDGSCDI